MISDTTWLDNHKWAVRGFAKGTSCGGTFRFPLPGKWIDCPDWNDDAERGGGFHVQAPGASGFGFVGSEIELVEYKGRLVVIGGEKAKVRRLRRMRCSPEVLAAAIRRCRIRVCEDGETYTIDGGLATILAGSPNITKKGGRLCVYGDGAPAIIHDGGDLWICGTGQPRIRQNSGETKALDTGAPFVAMSGGEVGTYSTSVPLIVQIGGVVRTYWTSSPSIILGGGEIQTYDTSSPLIVRCRRTGSIRKYDSSKPRIVKIGDAI